MKKEYKKPKLYFDSFELSSSIAAGCKLISNHSGTSCAVWDKDLGVSYFTEGVCTYTTTPGDGKICYDVPFDRSMVFSS